MSPLWALGDEPPVADDYCYEHAMPYVDGRCPQCPPPSKRTLPDDDEYLAAQAAEPDPWADLFGDRALSRAVIEPADPLGTPLPLFKRRVHALVGAGESGKSWLLAHQAATVAARGGHVVLVDGEMSAGRWRQRIITLIGERAGVLDHIAYLSMGDPAMGSLLDAVADRLDLIGVDSLGMFLATKVDSENSNSQVSRAMRPWRLLANRGPAVVYVDHTAKGSEVMTSRGASAKFNDLDVSYGFHLEGIPGTVDPWKVRITLEKDRDGIVGSRCDRTVTFDPQLGGRLALRYGDTDDQSHRLTGDRLADTIARIAALDPVPQTANEAAERVGGTRATALAAFKRWKG